MVGKVVAALVVVLLGVVGESVVEYLVDPSKPTVVGSVVIGCFVVIAGFDVL